MRYIYPIDGSGTTTDGNGKVLPSTTITAFLTGTNTPAKIYTAASGGTAVYSITSDSIAGTFCFYVDSNDYATAQGFDITFTNTYYGQNQFATKVIPNFAIMASGTPTNAIQFGVEVSVVASGTTITYSNPFTTEPALIITLFAAGLYTLSSVSATGFTISNYTGTINWVAVP